MFQKLSDFKYKRSPLQAFGFYITYFFLTVLSAMVIGALAGVITGANDTSATDMGLRLGVVVSVIFTTWLAYQIVMKKKLQRNFLNVFLIVLSGLLALLGGAFLGLLPAAYLSTK